MKDDDGQAFLLDLAEAVLLGDGDGLALDDGGILRVTAANEPVCDVTAQSPVHMARLVWHIGNRHTPVQVLATGALRIRYDHVLAEMATGLGASVERKQAPFEPEAGAYSGGGHGHSHDH